jgi:hypothetical protein
MKKILLICLLLSSPAYSALIHHYDFQAGVIDLVGNEDGTLMNGASVNGGELILDGVDDYVQFNTFIVPSNGDYSVVVIAKDNDVTQNSIMEIISQGKTGGPGFYIGRFFGSVRITDNWRVTNVNYPSDGVYHHIAMVVDSVADTTKIFIDGSLKNTLNRALATKVFEVGDTNTRFGNQFEPFSEYLNGSIMDIKIYDSSLTDNELLDLFNNFNDAMFKDGFE